MKPKFLNGKEKGQATIEYILLLFVVISLITGILLKFSVSFKAFADDALGDYIACLLETGELPDLEGSSASR